MAALRVLAAGLMLAVVAQPTPTPTPREQCARTVAAHYPRQYVAYKTDTPPVIDGRLDDDAWTEVSFSTSFVDINTTLLPGLDTRVKIRWDDTWLYVGALLQEPQVWANITYCCHCKNSSEDQVIFHGNDFEFFVDADATTRWYKEFEINAANADWDLLLDRPYENSGYENSTRVFGPDGFDMVPPLVSATYTDGVLNDPASKPTFWSVEIAFPIAKLVFKTNASNPPRKDDVWRINFSRVEWGVQVVGNRYWMDPSCETCWPAVGTPTCDNWVWTPMGVVDIHRPELWGVLQFATGEVNGTATQYYDQWPERYAAHVLYYAEVAYAADHNNTYTNDVEMLAQYTSEPEVLLGGCVGLPTIALTDEGQRYVAVIPSDNKRTFSISIDENRLIQAHHGGNTSSAVRFSGDEGLTL